MAVKTLKVDTDEIQKLYDVVEEQLKVIYEARAEFVGLLDRLTEADWNNHDSRRFERHYKRGEEQVAKDLNALEVCLLNHLEAAKTEYDALGTEVEEYFTTAFWADELVSK